VQASSRVRAADASVLTLAAVLVLEGAACAASLAESLVRLDLKTS